jgi:pimeloyl-ACP methyl ester carboxylesterase
VAAVRHEPELMNFRHVVAALVCAALAATSSLAWDAPPSAASPAFIGGECQGQSAHNTPYGTFSASRHPLVLVPGWEGSSDSMGPVQSGLAKKMPGTFDVRRFDYRGNRSDWAARTPIASCLADYINKISALQHDAGGDGKVYVVAHSMGGLAIRFATDKRTVPHPVPAAALGGVVTIDTPHLGSVFGNTWMADLVQWAKDRQGEPLLPGHTSDAAKCLAVHGPGNDLPSGCATPPYLPAGVHLAETAGTSTVRRTLFGIDLYDIPLSSDGVVGVDSAHGYRTSGVNGTKAPPPGASLPTTSCTITSDQTMALLQAAANVIHSVSKGAGLPAAIIGAEVKALQLFRTDSAILDAINSGQLTPDLEVLLGVALFFYPCGHNAVLGNATTLGDVATALSADLANSRPVTATDLLSAPVPASCTHPAGVLVDGKLPGIPQNHGNMQLRWLGDPSSKPKYLALGDLNGDGHADAATVLDCNAGGVSWPEIIAFYTAGPKLLGSVGLDSINLHGHSAGENDFVNKMSYSNGAIDVSWETEQDGDAAARPTLAYSATLRWNGRSIVYSKLSATTEVGTAQQFLADLRKGDTSAAADLAAPGVAADAANQFRLHPHALESTPDCRGLNDPNLPNSVSPLLDVGASTQVPNTDRVCLLPAAADGANYVVLGMTRTAFRQWQLAWFRVV